MSGDRDVVVLGLAGGGSESGIRVHVKFLSASFSCISTLNMCIMLRILSTQLSKKEKWVHSKKNVVNTIPLKITLLKAAYF